MSAGSEAGPGPRGQHCAGQPLPSKRRSADLCGQVRLHRPAARGPEHQERYAERQGEMDRQMFQTNKLGHFIKFTEYLA